MKISIPPFVLVITFFLPTNVNIHIIIVDISKNIKFVVNSGEKFRVEMLPPIPNINSKLSTHEPIKFPNSHICVFFYTSYY